MSRSSAVLFRLRRRARLVGAASVLALATAASLTSPAIVPSAAASAIAITQGVDLHRDGIRIGQGTTTVCRVNQGAVPRPAPREVPNGPNSRVYPSDNAAPQTRSRAYEGGAFEVGPLAGNTGAQNDSLQADLDRSEHGSAFNYCELAAVVFSHDGRNAR